MCQFHQELFTCATSCGPLLVFNGLEQAHEQASSQAPRCSSWKYDKLTSSQANTCTAHSWQPELQLDVNEFEESIYFFVNLFHLFTKFGFSNASMSNFGNMPLSFPANFVLWRKTTRGDNANRRKIENLYFVAKLKSDWWGYWTFYNIIQQNTTELIGVFRSIIYQHARDVIFKFLYAMSCSIILKMFLGIFLFVFYSLCQRTIFSRQCLL